MKKQRAPRTKGVVRTFFDFRSWSYADGLREMSNNLAEGIKRFFVIAKPETPRSVEDIAHEMGLSQEEVQRRQRGLWWMTILMLVLALAMFSYTLYHLIYLNWLAVSVSTMVTLLTLGFAFRYHFWYYQIQRGQFGCTFAEWFKYGFLGAKK